MNAYGDLLLTGPKTMRAKACHLFINIFCCWVGGGGGRGGRHYNPNKCHYYFGWGGPHHNYSIVYLPNPILILKAPFFVRFGDFGCSKK